MGPAYQLSGPGFEQIVQVKTWAAVTSSFCLGREVLEHLVHALVEVLNVLVGLVGKRVARRAAPDQLLALGVEQVDDQSADLIGIGRGRGVTKATPSPTAEAVIERVECLFVFCDLHGCD